MTLFRVQCRYPLFLDDFYPEFCFFKLINRKKYKGSDLDKSPLGLFNCYWKELKNCDTRKMYNPRIQDRVCMTFE